MKNSVEVKAHEVVADFIAVIVISALILLSVDNEMIMSVVVASVVVWRNLIYPLIKKDSLSSSLVFYIICVLLGGFNDWRSVDVKKIYEYHAPTSFPDFSSIPLWMYLYWGIILCLMSRLGRWNWGRSYVNSDELLPWFKKGLTSPVMKILGQLLLIFITRQTIYTNYLDPFYSWFPFVVAIVAYVIVFRVNVQDILFFFTAIILGTIVESAYITLANLHFYHLGIIYGVPVWITLWWGLSVLIWRDLSYRILSIWPTERLKEV